MRGRLRVSDRSISRPLPGKSGSYERTGLLCLQCALKKVVVLIWVVWHKVIVRSIYIPIFSWTLVAGAVKHITLDFSDGCTGGLADGWERWPREASAILRAMGSKFLERRAETGLASWRCWCWANLRRARCRGALDRSLGWCLKRSHGRWWLQTSRVRDLL